MVDRSSGIYGFFKEFRFLSNFYLCEVHYEGLVYPNAESAYQAAKTLDKNLRSYYTNPSMSPAAVRRAGQSLNIRPDWDSVKLEVMREINLDKFSRHEELRHALLMTDDFYLEETNTWGDRFWGVCEGEGENNLGKILMEIRKELR